MRVLLSSILILTLCTPLCGCQKGKGAAQEHAAAPAAEHGEAKPAEPAKWEPVKTEDDSFTASFPAPPIVQFNQTDEGKLILCGLNQADGVSYSIIMTQLNEPEPGPSVKERLQDVLAQAPLSYGKDAKVESTKLGIKAEGNPAVEYTLSFTKDGKKLKVRCRTFFANKGRQLFQLIAAGPEGAPDTQKFFDELKLGKFTPGKKPAATATPAPKAEGHGHEG